MNLHIEPWELRRMTLPANLPRHIEAHILAFRALETAYLAVVRLWSEALMERQDVSQELRECDQMLYLVRLAFVRAAAAYDSWRGSLSWRRGVIEH